MVGKGKIKKRLKQIQSLKNWQLFILLLLVIFVDLTALRLNNVGMVRRREAVEAADKVGDVEAARKATIEFANYVHAHMNSGGIVYSDKTHWFKINREVKIVWSNIYESDMRKAEQIAREAESNNPNGNIFKKAEETCRPRFRGGYSLAYQQCILDEQNKYPASNQGQIKAKYPNITEYTYSFVTPIWSPDLAGWTTLVATILIFMIIIKMITTTILKLVLKKYVPKV